ncbi:MAG TPA: glycerophosphodiester phosphodiesterase [Terracidiphilus sp.]|nr:glycerophosphodiester phosphodiesterase [Terracidiphilus sp.]
MSLLRIGHRGAAGHAPGNTLLSFEAALRFGVDLIEIDVQQTSDGHLIVLHDRNLRPSTNGNGPVESRTLEEIRKLRTVPGDLSIPTLNETIACVNGRAGFMVEIKVPGIAGQTLQTIRNAGFRGSVYYASFLHEELLAIRELDPGAPTIALLEGTPVNMTAFALDARATHAGLSIHSLSRRFVDTLHEAGIQVFTWTVDEPDQIAFAKSCGVDGLISNFPDRL